MITEKERKEIETLAASYAAHGVKTEEDFARACRPPLGFLAVLAAAVALLSMVGLQAVIPLSVGGFWAVCAAIWAGGFAMLAFLRWLIG